MVLGRDEDPAILVPDRLVCSPVPEFELVGIAADGKGRDLVAHADPEDREFPEQFPDTGNGIGGLLGITRTVADEQRVRPAGTHLVSDCIVGEDVKVPAPLREARELVLLDPKVDDSDAFPAARNMVRLFAGYLRNGNDIADREGLPGEFYRVFSVIAPENHSGTHRPMDTGPDSKCPRINTGHPEKMFLFKKGSDGRQGGRFFADLLCDRTEGTDAGVLKVLPVNTIIADEREREHQDLAEITGIRQGLHVPGHLCIENEFPGTFTFYAETLTHNNMPILKTQNRLHDFHM